MKLSYSTTIHRCTRCRRPRSGFLPSGPLPYPLGTMGTNDTCFTCQGGSFSHQKGSQDCLSYDTLVYNGEGAKGWIPGPNGAVFCSQKPVPAWNDYYLQGGCCAEVQALQEQLDSEHAFALLVVGVFFWVLACCSSIC